MRCFYHADREAVGVCKSCQRAICHECLADVGKGIACKGRCEDDARQLVALTDSAVRQQPTTDLVLGRLRRNRMVAALFYLLLGAGFIVAGVSFPVVQFAVFSAFMGVVFVFFGIYTLTQLPKRSAATADSKT